MKHDLFDRTETVENTLDPIVTMIVAEIYNQLFNEVTDLSKIVCDHIGRIIPNDDSTNMEKMREHNKLELKAYELAFGRLMRKMK